MKTYQGARRALKQKLSAFSHIAHSANALALLDDDSPVLSKSAMSRRQVGELKQRLHGDLPNSAACIAYTEAGNVCGLTPAEFLDLDRGGFVCSAHKPKRGLP